MKTSHKRVLVALTTLLLAAGVQWLAAVPFRRCPGEAFFVCSAVVLAAWMAACPYLDTKA